MTSYEDLMKAAPGTAERPVPLPAGTYRAELVKWEKRDVRMKDGESVPVIKIISNPVDYMEDVDAEALPDSWNRRQISLDFWMRPNTAYKLHDFLLKTLRGEAQDDDDLESMLDRMAGAEFIAHVTIRNDDEGEPRYNEVKKTAPLD